MTSKERVLRAVEFRKPDRVPYLLFNFNFHESDFAGCGAWQSLNFNPKKAGETEWGYVWKTLDETMGQPENIVIDDISQAGKYKAPDPDDVTRYRGMQSACDNNKDKFLLGSMGISGFTTATFLAGFENVLEALYSDRKNFLVLMNKVMDYENAVIKNLLKYDIDAIGFADDWGMQHTLMIDPKMWREVFKPLYKKQFDIIKKAGKKVYFHSCGYVFDIIGDLIEIGVDMFNFNQPDVMGIERLGQNFGGKVCFVCPVDVQTTAITGNKKKIYEYTQKLIDNFGRYNGGFIGYVEDYSSLNMPKENTKYCYDALKELGCYK